MPPLHLNIRAPRLGRNRLGVFFVRYPSYIDQSGKRRVIQKSLRTKDPATAKFMALKFCLDLATAGEVVSSNEDYRRGISPWTVNVSTGEIKAEGEEDHGRLMDFLGQHKDLVATLAKLRQNQLAATQPSAAPVAPAGPIAAGGKSLEQVFKLHVDVERVSLSEHTIGEKLALFRDFIAIFGAGTDLSAITAEQITTRWTPAETTRENKKFGGTLSLARLEKRRGYLAKFFDWASAGGLYGHDNPMKAKLGKKKQIRQQTASYAEFSSEELQRLFSPAFMTHMNKPDWYWVPLIGLFTGARLSEICDLQIADFRIEEDIKLFEIREGKTPDSRRIVPLHSALLDLGLWDYVEALRARGATFLLHHRQGHSRGKSVGREFGIWIDACKIHDDRKVFHSFRSTAITTMHNARASAAAIRKIVGHTSSDMAGVHGDYVRELLIVRLRQAIETLRFPTIDTTTLKLGDPTFKAFFDEDEAFRNSPAFRADEERRRKHEQARQKRLAGQPLSF